MKTRVLSFILAAVMLVSAVALASCGNKSFDYMKEDLTGYITLTEADYMNIPVSIDTGITTSDIYAEISEKLGDLADDKLAGIAKTDKAIANDDVVAIYYKGVTVDKDGKETEFAGGTNFGEEKPTWLYIGSDSFIDGFEDALVGKKPADTSVTFVTEGTVKEGDFIVIEIAGMYDTDKTYMSYKNLAVTLGDNDILPESVTKHIADEKIGEELTFISNVDADGDSETEEVSFAAKILRKVEMNAEKISVKFPSTYSDSSLAGKDAFFYVVMEKVVSADDATVEALGYEKGDDAVAALKAGAEKTLIDEYIAELKGKEEDADYGVAYDETVKTAIWAAISDKDYEVVYPEGTIDAYIKTAKNNLEYDYYAYIDAETDAMEADYNSSADLQSKFKNFATYAAYKMGDTNWKAALEKEAKEAVYGKDDSWETKLPDEAKDFVKRKLVFYSVAKALDVNSATKAEIKAIKEEIRTSTYSYYLQMYTLYNIMLNWGYTDANLKSIAEDQTELSMEGISDTFLKETAIKKKILEKLYENYDADSLVTWTTALSAKAEDNTESAE